LFLTHPLCHNILHPPETDAHPISDETLFQKFIPVISAKHIKFHLYLYREFVKKARKIGKIPA
ncbi:MAG: hypothetical protein MR208_06745, partial [Oscillospiraceae bacterium]|nr:hypothetical protein [Oscillospiraceae bacterium]